MTFNDLKGSSSVVQSVSRTAFLLILLVMPILAGCDAIGQPKLEVYESEALGIKLPILQDWEVQVEQSGQEGTAFLTMSNENSGVLVTRAPIDQLFPTQADGSEIEVYLNSLIEISQGTLNSTGPVEVQRKSGYRQATAPIALQQIGEISGASNGTILLAMQEEEAIVAVFFCSKEQLDLCEADLARSVKGFKVLNP